MSNQISIVCMYSNINPNINPILPPFFFFFIFTKKRVVLLMRKFQGSAVRQASEILGEYLNLSAPFCAGSLGWVT